jgi:hypothetical protein
MDVADLRKRISREIERAKLDAAERRHSVDAAHAAFDSLLSRTIVPLVQQTAGILKAERLDFQVFTPAGSVRMVSEGSNQNFVEFELDPSAKPPRVVGRISQLRGRQGVVIEERPVGGEVIEEISEEDVLEFLMPALRRFIAR